LIVESKPTEELARFAVETTYDDLPDSARDHARNLLFDAVSCALAGDIGDETKSYAAFARMAGGEGRSTVIGSSEQLSPLGATLLNGYLITAVTVCDTYVPAHVHITPEVIPPALALAEQDGASGKALLTAIAVGAEVAVRVANGIDYSVSGALGWHFPGIIGPFGAAAAVGRLNGLTQLQMRNAFGLAGSQSAGTWASWGSPAVKFHQSRGAASGLLAGLLAKTDFVASAEILAHPDGGILAAYSDGGKPGAITDSLGTRYDFEQVSLRLWPGGTPLQCALTGIFDLVASHQPAFKQVDRVRVVVAPGVYKAHVGFAEPKGKFETLLSFQFVVAAALRDGRFWLDSLDDENDPELRAFMRDKVEFVAEDTLTPDRARVEIMVDGKTLTAAVEAAKGSPRNPVTQDELREKYDRCIAGRLAKAEANELANLLFKIEQTDDLSRLFGLLRAARQRSQ
jgi:2-methylcitrate dehydratase PrpD